MADVQRHVECAALVEQALNRPEEPLIVALDRKLSAADLHRLRLWAQAERDAAAAAVPDLVSACRAALRFAAPRSRTRRARAGKGRPCGSTTP